MSEIQNRPSWWSSAKWLLALFLLFALAIGVTGYFYFERRKEEARRNAFEILATIAQLQVGEIKAWRAERLADAEAIAGNPLTDEAAAQVIEGTADPAVREKVRQWLASLQVYAGYRSIALVDGAGHSLLFAGEAGGLGDMARQGLEEALASGKLVFLDLHAAHEVSFNHMGLIVPVKAVGQGKPAGAVIVRIDPAANLYPILAAWPVPTRTGETLFVRIEGKEVLFLNPLRFERDAALRLRRPVSTPGLPAAMVAQGKEGEVEGRDYAGREVLAFVRAIPDSPWFIVAKADRSEMMVRAREDALGIFLAALFLVLATGGVMASVWRHQTVSALRLEVAAERERAEEALRESEEKYRYMFANNPQVMWIYDLETLAFLEVNNAAILNYGYTKEEFLSMTLKDIRPQEDLDALMRDVERTRRTYNPAGEWRHLKKNGELINVEIISHSVTFKDRPARHVMVSDITERKRAENTLRETKEHLENLIGNANAPIIVWDAHGKITRFNQAFEEISGLKSEQVLGQSLDLLFAQDQRDRAMGLVARASTGERFDLVEVPILHTSGSQRTVLWNSAPVFGSDGKTQVATIAHGLDVTERKRAEEALSASENRYRRLFEAARDGILILDAETGAVVDVNPFLMGMLGYSREEIIGMKVWELGFFRDIVANQDNFEELQKKEYIRYEDMPLKTSDGRQMDVEFVSNVYLVNQRKVIQCNIRDITERKRAEEELARRAEELARSNAELQQFAYVASHDLQEPLRVVASYVQLLSRRYQGKLDAEADEFIAFAVEGAKRMQVLINDLLNFSRVGTKGAAFTVVPSGGALDQALANLGVALSEAGAQVTRGPLPAVKGDHKQLVQLFQNLVGNAVKFRGPDPPRIRVDAISKGREWVFSVKDNGIGIEPRFFDRIFIIFQRLHGKEEFSGTGIGLALCQKIVQRHKGKIWVESNPGEGSTFFFTLPKG